MTFWSTVRKELVVSQQTELCVTENKQVKYIHIENKHSSGIIATPQ